MELDIEVCNIVVTSFRKVVHFVSFRKGEPFQRYYLSSCKSGLLETILCHPVLLDI